MGTEEGKPVRTSTFPVASMTTSSAWTDSRLAGLEPCQTRDSPLAPDITPLPIQHCVYRGEGNANIVLALPKERKVIRFRKSLPTEVPPDGGKARVEREVEFARDVISFFLGTYVQIPDILRCDTNDVARICDAIRPFRPEKRRHKEITGVYATKLPDYTFIPTKNDPALFGSNSTFCVEIKPKQGYLREGGRRYRKCPYCLTQYYKLKKKAIVSRSGYCPFDLFSGVRERMKRSLKSLLKSPQNNLKIFKDGRLVYDQESSPSDLDRLLTEWFKNDRICTREAYVEQFCDLVCAALLFPFAQDRSKPSSALFYDFRLAVQRDTKMQLRFKSNVVAEAEEMLRLAAEECNTEGQCLPKDSVLERILSMQRLPYVTTEYIYYIYSKYYADISDDVVYSNLSKLYAMNVPRMGTTVKSMDTAQDAYPELSAKDVPTVKRQSDDLNGNPYINFDSPWSVATTVRTGTLPLTSQSNCQELNRKNVYSYDCNQVHNENDVIYGEQNKSTTIGIETLLALQNYLLFSTARDCSILMAFQEFNSEAFGNDSSKAIINLPGGLRFLCNIGVSDLDPKSVQCIEKHRQRDMEVINSVISVLEEEVATRNPAAAKRSPPW